MLLNLFVFFENHQIRNAVGKKSKSQQAKLFAEYFKQSSQPNEVLRTVQFVYLNQQEGDTRLTTSKEVSYN